MDRENTDLSSNYLSTHTHTHTHTPHNRTLITYKKECNRAKWNNMIDMKCMIFSEISQTVKDKYCVFLLIYDI